MIENVWALSILSVVIISLISLIGVFFLSMKHKILHNLLLLLVGFAVGALLGDVFIHILPEVSEEFGFDTTVSLAILAGIIIFFILEKFVQWRHCHVDMSHTCKEHPVRTLNLFADALHNFVDGMLIAGSYLASVPVGIATTIAVFLHEIPQEIGDFAVLIHSGMSRKKALFMNFLSALTSVLGAVVVLMLSSTDGIFKLILPFTAGGFIYIAAADLLPELHKREYTLKSAAFQLVSILIGIAVMFALVLLE